MKVALMTRLHADDYTCRLDTGAYDSAQAVLERTGLKQVENDTKKGLFLWLDGESHFLKVTGIPSGRRDVKNTSIRYNIVLQGNDDELRECAAFFVGLLADGKDAELAALGKALDEHVVREDNRDYKDGVSSADVLRCLDTAGRKEGATPLDKRGFRKEWRYVISSSLVRSADAIREVIADGIPGGVLIGVRLEDVPIKKKSGGRRWILLGILAMCLLAAANLLLKEPESSPESLDVRDPRFSSVLQTASSPTDRIPPSDSTESSSSSVTSMALSSPETNPPSESTPAGSSATSMASAPDTRSSSPMPSGRSKEIPAADPPQDVAEAPGTMPEPGALAETRNRSVEGMDRKGGAAEQRRPLPEKEGALSTTDADTTHADRNTLFALPRKDGAGQAPPSDIAAQTVSAMRVLEGKLRDAGRAWESVVRLTLSVRDENAFAGAAEACVRFLGERKLEMVRVPEEVRPDSARKDASAEASGRGVSFEMRTKPASDEVREGDGTPAIIGRLEIIREISAKLPDGLLIAVEAEFAMH